MTYIPPTTPKVTVGDFSSFYPKVLLHCEGTNGSQTLTDSSLYNKTYTASGAVLSTSVYKYGSSSIYFDGTASYKVPLDNSNGLLNCDDKDFTMEMWVYPTQLGVGYQAFLASSTDADQQGPVLFTDNNAFIFAWARQGTNNWVASTGSSALSTNQWYHVAIVRRNAVNTISIYLNGQFQNSVPVLSNFLMRSSANWNIGYYAYFPGGQKSMYGYVDDVRITIGQALYTGNFTPGPISDPIMPAGTFVGDMKQDSAGNIFMCTDIVAPTWKQIKKTVLTGMP